MLRPLPEQETHYIVGKQGAGEAPRSLIEANRALFGLFFGRKSLFDIFQKGGSFNK
jgi:hypothetical protein